MAVNNANNAPVIKNAAGQPRKPGTKDYALILSSLMTNRNALIRNESDAKAATESIFKVAVKLQELGFTKQGEVIKSLVKRKVNTSYKWREDRLENWETKKEKALEYAEKFWNLGKEKHQKIKDKSTR